MKTMVLTVTLLLAMAGIVDAQVETLTGPLSFTMTSTDEKLIIDKYGYSTRKLVNVRDSVTGFICMYEPSIRVPDTRLELIFSDGTNVVVNCLATSAAGVASKANNTYAVAKDKVKMQYSCHMTSILGDTTIETDAVSLFLTGKARTEKGDLTDTISKITLKDCTLSGGGSTNGDYPFLFKATFYQCCSHNETGG